MKKALLLMLVFTVVFVGCSLKKTESKDITEKNVELKADNHDIPAVITIPSGEVKNAIVMLHGTGSNKDEAGDGYKVISSKLAKEYNIATIRIDFIGNGDSKADYVDYNFKSAVSDALVALNALKEELKDQKEVNYSIMGWSQGGTIAMLAAGENPELFKNVITLAGALDLSGMMSDEKYNEAKKNGYFVQEFDWREPLKVSLEWCEDVKNTDVLSVFKGFKGDALVINGEKDDVVLPEVAKKIFEASQSKGSKLEIVKDADHTYNVFSQEDKSTIKEVGDIIGKWINR